MTVDAIVVNFNARRLLRACLASLARSAYPVRRTYVVDNASCDGSAEMVVEEFPSVTLLRLPQNVGFARANNMAFGQSDAGGLLLLNSDAELSETALGELVAALAADERVGIAGPVLLGRDGRIQFEGARRDPSIVGEFGNISHLNVRLPTSPFGRYLMHDWDHRSTRDVDALCGACMLVRTSALDGRLFSEAFFMYGEDVELCQRLRARGWRMRYVAGAQVLHAGAGSSQAIRTRMRVAGVISMAQLLARARGRWYALCYVAMVPIAWPLGLLVRKAWPL